MDTSDYRKPEVVSDLMDLRQVNLADMDERNIESALRRIVPDAFTQRVPVAAFNSCI
jgi:FXSXX-COOH protein